MLSMIEATVNPTLIESLKVSQSSVFMKHYIPAIDIPKKEYSPPKNEYNRKSKKNFIFRRPTQLLVQGQ